MGFGNRIFTNVVELWTTSKGRISTNVVKPLIYRQAMRGAYGCYENIATGLPFLQLRRNYQIVKHPLTSRADLTGYAAWNLQHLNRS
jgi:hypothetical protein